MLHFLLDTFSNFQAYFKQQTIDTRVLAGAFATLLDGRLTNNYAPFYQDALYLQSYSLDPSNYFAYPLSTSDATVDTVSGYFDQVRFYKFLKKNGFVVL